MRVLLRIATGMARNRSPENRWRQVSVPAAAMVCTVLLLASFSVLGMLAQQAERAAARDGQIATSRSATDLFVVQRSDSFGDETIAVIWIAPASASAVPVLPAGLTRLPAPGQAAVSPALDRLAARFPQLAARYPNRIVIDWSGVRGGDELLAYVRPQPGRGLGGEESAVELRNGQFTGELPVFRISRFGATGESEARLRLGDPSPTPLRAVVGGAGAALTIPALVVLAIGVSAASAVREHRFAVLRAIGVTGRTLGFLAAAETLTLAAPGIAIAVVLAAVASARLTTVPLVGYGVVRGDLTPSWWWTAATVVAVAAASAVFAVLAAAAAGRDRTSRPRPAGRRPGFARLRYLPLAAAIAVFALGRLVSGYRAADLYLLGVVVAVAAVPAVVPVLLRPIGALLARSRSTSPAIAGRALQWDPTRVAMPYVGGAALLVLVLAGIGYVAVQRNTDSPVSPPGAAHAVIAEWRDPRPGDFARISAAAGAAWSAPFTEGRTGEHDEPGGHDGPLTVGARCADLARLLPGATCVAGSPFVLPPATSQRLASVLAVVAHEQSAAVLLRPPAELVDADGAIFVDDAPIGELAERVRTAAAGLVPASTVETTLWGGSRESPLVPWIIGGATVAAVGLAFACLLSLVDRLLAARRRHRLLVNLGIRPRQLAALGAWMFAVPYVAVCAASFLAGLAICALLVSPDTAMPWGPIGLTAAVTLAVGLVGSLSVAFLGARHALKESE